MKKIVSFSLLLVALFSSVASADLTVFMNNGETIRARRAWREDTTVYVLVNRDILLDFQKEEVDLHRTRIPNVPRSSRLLDQVLRATAMRKQINSFTAAFSQGGDPASAESSDEVTTMMKESFDASAAWKTMRQEMARKLDERTLAEVLRWYSSPTGRKVAAIEAASDPDRKRKMEAFLDEEMTEEGKAKFELIQQIEKTVGLSEFEVRLTRRMMGSMVSAIPAEIPNKEKMGELMKQSVADKMSLDKVRKGNVATIAYQYRDLSVDEVKEVLEFQRSPSGSKYSKVTISGIEKVMDGFMSRFRKKFHTALLEMAKSNQ